MINELKKLNEKYENDRKVLEKKMLKAIIIWAIIFVMCCGLLGWCLGSIAEIIFKK